MAQVAQAPPAVWIVAAALAAGTAELARRVGRSAAGWGAGRNFTDYAGHVWDLMAALAKLGDHIDPARPDLVQPPAPPAHWGDFAKISGLTLTYDPRDPSANFDRHLDEVFALTVIRVTDDRLRFGSEGHKSGAETYDKMKVIPSAPRRIQSRTYPGHIFDKKWVTIVAGGLYTKTQAARVEERAAQAIEFAGGDPRACLNAVRPCAPTNAKRGIGFKFVYLTKLRGDVSLEAARSALGLD